MPYIGLDVGHINKSNILQPSFKILLFGVIIYQHNPRRPIDQSDTSFYQFCVSMKPIFYPIIFILIFWVMQAVATVVVLLGSAVSNTYMLEQIVESGTIPSNLIDTASPELLAWSILASGIVTMAILALLQKTDWKRAINIHIIDWGNSLAAIIGAIVCIMSLNITMEFFSLPDTMETLFIDMAASPIGLFTMGVVSPVVEEFVFRESVLGHMLHRGMQKWMAIIISSLLFGVIHMNPVQIPFAAGIGLVLGIIYYKTGNIVITSIIHIINNSLAAWQLNLMGTEIRTYSIIEEMGGPTIAFVGMSAGIGCSIWLIFHFWKHYKKPINS